MFVSLTNNNRRQEGNVANTRLNNTHGHIIELQPPVKDHTAAKFDWRIFLRGGNPAEPADDALYAHAVSENGWLSCPDNLTLDPQNRLWICTDGMDKSAGTNDGLFASDVGGEAYGQTKLFFTGPLGCEVTGPAFTPDGKTLFLSVQHPGDNNDLTSDFNTPVTRWPDFKPNMPPRPSVLAIRKKDGGVIGS